MNASVWKGVIIEEGLKDTTLLNQVKIVRTDMEQLESEGEMGTLHFHKVEVEGTKIDEVVEMAKNSLLHSWYIHLVKDGEMKVIFEDIAFEVRKGDTEQLRNIKEYALSQDILEEQIELDRLIDNPYDEGRPEA